MSKKKKIIIAVIIICVVGLIGSGMSGQSNSTTNSSADTATTAKQETWDANTELFGQTVEKAWDQIEAKGYTIKIKSIKGAELNSDENNHHSSTTQTWRVTKAELDESAKTVTVTVTSNDDFTSKYGASAKK